jgi:hypothetical protein
MSAAVDAAARVRPRPLVGALVGILLAVIGNTIVYFVALAVRGSAVQATMDGTTAADVPYAAVIVSTALPILVGAGVLWLISRFTGSALRVWTIIALVIIVLSLSAPVLLPVDLGSKLALGAMHIVAGTSAIVGQRWAANRRRSSAS